jgi:hypothetical protein
MDTKIGKNIDQYIQLVYSEKSEFNQIPDLEERKKSACIKAKLDYQSESVQKIIHLKDNKVNQMIFDFCRTQFPNEFILLISKEHLFWEQMQLLMEPLKKVTEDGATLEVDDEAMLKRINLKNTISEKSDKLLESITELRSKLFTGEKEQHMAQEKMRIMRPEERLKKKSA